MPYLVEGGATKGTKIRILGRSPRTQFSTTEYDRREYFTPITPGGGESPFEPPDTRFACSGGIQNPLLDTPSLPRIKIVALLF
jgi:hypothetical protein